MVIIQLDLSSTSQTHLVAASLTLEFFNCFSWGNCIESYKVKDDFNAKFFKLENRPSANLKDYKKITERHRLLTAMSMIRPQNIMALTNLIFRLLIIKILTISMEKLAR